MAYTNVHRMARISPKKARLVMNMIRGKSLADALNILEMNKRRAAVLIKQSLLAAQANADQAEADVRRLKVVQARVDEGPTIKRFRPKDRGRAHQILKRTSHLMVGVE
jgi:large subunit ribosomal protein L22